MALYAMADLHLSLGTNKPMDDFKGWHRYMERIQENWLNTIKDEDIVVVAGDVSWGMSMEQALEDFRFLDSLPGTKLLLKGNHDYWWETRRKMERFFEEHCLDSLRIVHNDCFDLGDGRAVCGTRGWFYDAEADADKKVLMREIGRLHTSVEAARSRGLEPLVFLHYPPLFAGALCREMIDALTELKIKQCFYGHIHGRSAFEKSFCGVYNGITMQLVSADYLQFAPLLIP